MLGKRTENPRPVTLPEVKDILKARSTQPDFGYEQQTSLDYVKRFAHLTAKDAQALYADLNEVEGMKPEAAAKIVDLLPAFPSTLQAILAKDKVTLNDKALAKVAEMVASAREKMIEPEIVVPAAAPTPMEEGKAAEAAASEGLAASKAAESTDAAEGEGKKKAKAE